MQRVVTSIKNSSNQQEWKHLGGAIQTETLYDTLQKMLPTISHS